MTPIRVFTVKEAVDFINEGSGDEPRVSLNTLYEEVASGRLKHRRVGKKGGKILISEDNLREWLKGDAVAC